MKSSLQDLIERGRPALLARFGHKLTAHQRQALDAMVQCRTGALGSTAMACAGCDQLQYRHRSCGHRSCPRCQHHAATDWLERQRNKLLPAPYFMVTFTLPAALRPLAYRHQGAVYDLLFQTAISTLRSFGVNHDDLQAEPAATAVLHTHTRRLDYHPHLHVVVPGAGIGRGRQWRKVKGRYLFNGRALGRVFRARFLAALKRHGFEPPADLPRSWVVQCQNVGEGLSALKYLSRYLYRGVIAERAIVDFDPDTEQVTFAYQESKSRRRRRQTLPLVDFLWRLMIHVLPSGYRRVRDFGFLHGNAKRTRAVIQMALRVCIPPATPRTRTAFRCPNCCTVMTVRNVCSPPAPST